MCAQGLHCNGRSPHEQPARITTAVVAARNPVARVRAVGDFAALQACTCMSLAGDLHACVRVPIKAPVANCMPTSQHKGHTSTRHAFEAARARCLHQQRPDTIVPSLFEFKQRCECNTCKRFARCEHSKRRSSGARNPNEHHPCDDELQDVRRQLGEGFLIDCNHLASGHRPPSTIDRAAALQRQLTFEPHKCCSGSTRACRMYMVYAHSCAETQRSHKIFDHTKQPRVVVQHEHLSVPRVALHYLYHCTERFEQSG